MKVYAKNMSEERKKRLYDKFGWQKINWTTAEDGWKNNEHCTKTGENSMKALFDWDVDWEKQDVVIANELGCSRERVRQKRKELGIKRSKFYHSKNSSRLTELADYDTTNKTIDELSKTFNCSGVYLKSVLKEMGKKYVSIDKRRIGKYDWSLADFNKTDKQVADALGIPNSGVVTTRRRRLGIIKYRRNSKATKEKRVWLTNKASVVS